jgi:hypothetical protein
MCDLTTQLWTESLSIDIVSIMILKTLILPLLALNLIVTPALAQVSTQDTEDVLSQLELIQSAINEQNVSGIQATISPNVDPALWTAIESAINSNDVTLLQKITSVKKLENNNIKIKTRFSIKGPNWEASGFSNWYVFEKVEQKWLLKNTNFHTKLTSKSTFLAFIPMFVIALLWVIFWIWMLIDLTNAPIQGKAKWVILMLFTGAIGSAIYYFTARRKYRRVVKS